MSAQTMSDVFAPIEARYRSQVMKQTWGHLAPSRNKKYRGTIAFAIGMYGSDHLNPTVIQCDLKTRFGEELDASPWFYDALQEFLQQHCHMEGFEEPGDYQIGCVYQFTGFFRNYVFDGSVKQVWPMESSCLQ